ncbi:MAG: xanthine dehydrogenase family protein subunit M [Chloroflexi bacterium]|nr:xanthine dehydrogenase family protein subunit M [Chloroflexota bacterium]
MRHFDYARPTSLAEAVRTLRSLGEGARPLGGGTDLLVQVKEGHLRPAALVSLAGIAELDGVGLAGDGSLRVGARATMQEVADHAAVRERFSALADGAAVVGSYQTRNAATIGGNVCNAAPSADTSPPLVALSARAQIAGVGGEREIAVEELWSGPGRTTLEPGEIVTAFVVPTPPPGSGSHYERHTPRKVMDIAVVGVSTQLTIDGGVVAAARIALGAVAPTVIRAVRAERSLIGRAVSGEVAAEAGRIAASEATPIDDVRGTVAFRRYLVEKMTSASVLRSAERALG